MSLHSPQFPPNIKNLLNLAPILNRHLGTQIRARSELVVGHVQPELFGDIIVVLRRLVTRATSAMEAGARVDARGRDVAVVLARQRVAGAADGPGGIGEDEGGGGQQEAGENGEGLHIGG
ncbi:hypothetical protein ABOM_011118 [Aspergillus bombycis]|uniref:Uncharacterized protein n=1 Tax=Aspergillus bombycis TaxID=109264 RepID=A0A1F7ZLA8_9EURO|nr:hypothetical protein ABOM_011118 [Aspergillus bombycis]OGM40224.1 hypothetical protein ABOM_011118 [Aspergillus bombycis]